MNKKYIILSIVVILAIIIGITIFFTKKAAKNALPTEPSKITDTSSNTFPIAPPASSPIWGERYQVTDPATEIRSVFLNQLSKKITPSQDKEIQAIYFYDKTKKIIPLTTMQSALNFYIQPDIFRMIDDNSYELFYCPQDSYNDIGIIFYLNAPATGSLSDSDYQNAKTLMKKWEPTMLKDLHSILFPSINFSDNETGKLLEFKDGESRYAEILLPNKGKSSINYKLNGSPIIISTSSKCLRNAEGYFFDTEEK